MPISSKSSKVSSPNRKIQDVPELPTITGVSENSTSATALDVAVNFSQFGGRPEVLRATSTPGNIQGISFGSSPITVNGLTPGTNYNFTVTAETSQGANRGATAPSAAANTPTGALVPIATFSGTSTFTFTNIPQTYQDLRLVYTIRAGNSGNDAGKTNQTYIIGSINGDTSFLYSFAFLEGDGSTRSAGYFTGQNVIYYGIVPNANATAGIFGSGYADFLNYRDTNTFKTVITNQSSDTNGSGNVRIVANLYRSTAAITSISMSTPQMVAGSTVTLYGIKGA
jgi:hypothetical protein